MIAIYFQANAALLLESLRLGAVTYLSPGEVKKTGEMTAMPLTAERTWEYWSARANLESV